MNNSSVSFTQVGAEPVTLTDMKNYLRIDSTNTSDDALVTALIAGCRSTIEGYLNKVVVQKTVALTFDYLPASGFTGDMWFGPTLNMVGGFNLPYGPIQSVTSIQVTDSSNNTTTWTASNYIVDLTGQRIAYSNTATFPTTYPNINGVVVNYVAGYADITGLVGVPGGIIQAIRHFVAHCYENRESAEVVPPTVCALLTPFKKIAF